MIRALVSVIYTKKSSLPRDIKLKREYNATWAHIPNTVVSKTFSRTDSIHTNKW